MAVPETIKVLREEGYHTDQIGEYGDRNQFMGFVTATLPMPLHEDWEAHKRWYAVLHTFDKKGKHLNTEAWFAGTTASGEHQARQHIILDQRASHLASGTEQGRVR